MCRLQAAEASIAKLRPLPALLAAKEAEAAKTAAQLSDERIALQDKHKAFERVKKVTSQLRPRVPSALVAPAEPRGCCSADASLPRESGHYLSRCPPEGW